MSLKYYIHQKIRDNGVISFAEFVNLALYTENLGYYQKIHFGTDFITAPEISNLFSQTMANYISNYINGNILEFGAGSGIMAADILLYLEQQDCLPDKYFIIEISNKLQQKQQETIQKYAPHLLEKVHWMDEMPVNFNGIILLNEVLDAIPAERFIIQNQKTYALNVGLDDTDNFCNIVGESISLELPFDNYPNNFISEYNLRAEFFIKDIMQKLNQGLLIIVDYGYENAEYYHPQRNQGTLTCFFQHHQHQNPFINVGEQDISVHVNFSHIVKIIKKISCKILSFQTQSQFLLHNGITKLAEKRDLNNTQIRLKTSQEIQKLTMPTQMGETIKVLVVTKE